MKKTYYQNHNPIPGVIFQRAVYFIIFWILGSLSWGCSPLRNSDVIINPDLSPPQFTALTVQSKNLIILSFDEPSIIPETHISIKPGLEPGAITSAENSIQIQVPTQIPGAQYTLTATAMDNHKNSLQFMTHFYGYNPDIPGLIINEFITKGSSTHPDLIELKVTSPGNMGGIVCYQGTDSDWDDRYIFPPLTVHKGNFILIHFKPQGLDLEIDETNSPGESGGLDASQTAFDFWVKEGSGLSGNNGVLTLYSCPGGSIIDGVLYSNRTSQSDESYLGFGSKKIMDRALELASTGGWNPRGPEISPEDGINPDESTSTRSLCRNRFQADTNTNDDWHIVPTRGATFGQENNDEVYKE